MVPEITPGPDLRTPGVFGRWLALRWVELNLPNLITLARLLSVPLAIWLILDGRYGFAFWVFIGAGVSDALDGYIAKRFDRRTRLGALLDPTADKTLLVGVYVTLGLVGQLPAWLVSLVILRDFLIVVGFILIRRTVAPQQLRPLVIGKINTLVQLILVGFVLAPGIGIETESVTNSLLIPAAAVTTVLSGLAYLARLGRLLVASDRVL